MCASRIFINHNRPLIVYKILIYWAAELQAIAGFLTSSFQKSTELQAYGYLKLQ